MGTVNAFIISRPNHAPFDMKWLLRVCIARTDHFRVFIEVLWNFTHLSCFHTLFSYFFTWIFFSKSSSFYYLQRMRETKGGLQPGKVDNHRITISYPGRGRACLHVRTLFSIRDNSETRYLLRKASAVVLKLKPHIMQVLYLKKNYLIFFNCTETSIAFNNLISGTWTRDVWKKGYRNITKH